MVAVWTLKVSAISLTDFPSFMSRRTKCVCSGLSFRRAPEVNPPPSGRLPAGAGAFPDQVAFKLGNSRKHGHDQLASVTSSVGPGFGQRLKAGASLAYGFHCFQSSRVERAKRSSFHTMTVSPLRS
jgi:hypothetical protein